ncbi:MAG: hypothetical protein JSV25_08030 [Spirochaetota bacterium]|nr:MAG: hypothetical protein JSV25_08030 [Spirochaetota bacterium]
MREIDQREFEEVNRIIDKIRIKRESKGQLVWRNPLDRLNKSWVNEDYRQEVWANLVDLVNKGKSTGMDTIEEATKQADKIGRIDVKLYRDYKGRRYWKTAEPLPTGDIEEKIDDGKVRQKYEE